MLPSDEPVPELTLWEEIVEYIKTKYFFAYAGVYENFTIGESTAMSIAIIIIGLVLGMIAAVVLGYFRNNTAGRVVRAIILQQAYSEDKAKTLSELGVEPTFLVRRALRSRSFLRKYVHYVGEPVFSSNAYFSSKRDTKNSVEGEEEKVFSGYNPYLRERIDFENARFYIPDELHYAADVRYDKKGFGNSLPATIICVVALIAMGIICLRVFPVLIQMADNLTAIIKG